MYNEHVKSCYLQTLTKDKSKATQSLNFADRFIETVYGKDLALCSREEIIDGLQHSSYFNLSAYRNVVYDFRKYITWCIENQIFPITKNEVSYINIDELNMSYGVEHNLIKSPDALIQSITTVYSLYDAYVAIPVLCFRWIGLSYEQIARLRDGDVNLELAQVIVSDDAGQQIFHLPQRFVEPLRIYKNTKKASRMSGNEFDVYADEIGYFCKKMLVKNSKKVGSPFTPRQLQSAVYRFSISYSDILHGDYHFDQDSVYKSSICYDLYNLENRSDDFERDSYIYIVQLLNDCSMRTYKDFMILYAWYKKVFWGIECR